jgi:HrpA-like RNA helicase
MHKYSHMHTHILTYTRAGDHLTMLNVYHAYKQNEGDEDWCWNNYLSARALANAERIRKQVQCSV